MNHLKKITLTVLIILAAPHTQAARGTIRYTQAHRQQGLECGYFAALHALEALGQTFHDVRGTIDRWKEATKEDRKENSTIHSTTIETILESYPLLKNRIFILDSKNACFHLRENELLKRNIFTPAINFLENNRKIAFIVNLGLEKDFTTSTHWIMIEANYIRRNDAVNLTIKDSMVSTVEQVERYNKQPMHMNIKALQEVLCDELRKRNQERLDQQIALTEHTEQEAQTHPQVQATPQETLEQQAILASLETEKEAQEKRRFFSSF